MTEKIKILLIALLCVALMMVVSFCGGWSLRGKQMQTPTADTITITRVDTVTLVENKIDTLIRYVNRLYPVTVHDTTLIVRHTTDSVYISLPYQYRYYSKPDTLEVWYSGIDPKIDSTTIYIHRTTEIIKQPYDVVKIPRLTLDVGVGGFYYDRQVNPHLKGELRYNAKKTTWSVYGAIDHQMRWGTGASVSYRLNLLQ